MNISYQFFQKIATVYPKKARATTAQFVYGVLVFINRE